MNKLFLDYNLSLELKELGFNLPCLANYHFEDGFYWLTNNKGGWVYENTNDYYDNECSAPLKQQVFFFFRSKYNIESEIRVMAGSNIHGLRVKGKEKMYQYWIHNLNDKHWSSGETVSNEFETYEQAESECINKLISLIKEK